MRAPILWLLALSALLAALFIVWHAGGLRLNVEPHAREEIEKARSR